MLKKVALLLFAMAIGCAGAVAIQSAGAQSYSPNPQAPRWEQYCEVINPMSLRRFEQLNSVLAQRGAEGWELVQLFEGGTCCFKRPAP